MLPTFFIALITAVGASAWIYSKVMNRTGGNTQNALIVSGVAAIMIFVITLTVLSIVENITG